MVWCGQCHTRLGEVAAPSPSRFVPASEQVAWTIAMALVVAMALFSQNPFAIGPLCFILVPLVMRSVWANGRVS